MRLSYKHPKNRTKSQQPQQSRKRASVGQRAHHHQPAMPGWSWSIQVQHTAQHRTATATAGDIQENKPKSNNFILTTKSAKIRGCVNQKSNN